MKNSGIRRTSFSVIRRQAARRGGDHCALPVPPDVDPLHARCQRCWVDIRAEGYICLSPATPLGLATKHPGTASDAPFARRLASLRGTRLHLMGAVGFTARSGLEALGGVLEGTMVKGG